MCASTAAVVFDDKNAKGAYTGIYFLLPFVASAAEKVLTIQCCLGGVRRRNFLPLGMDFYSVTKTGIYGWIMLRLVMC